MEISLRGRDTDSLAAFSRVGIQLLLDGSIERLGEQFGYALAFERSVPVAIAADLGLSLREAGVGSLAELSPELPTVVRYAPNNTGLIAAVSVVLSLDAQPKLEVDFVVTAQGSQTFMSLEQISCCGPI